MDAKNEPKKLIKTGTRIDRFIDYYPDTMARRIRVLLCDFKNGKVDREKVLNEVSDNLEAALNTIDGYMGRYKA